MKIWIVGEDREFGGYLNVGVHQVEEYADRQADELMAVGEWSDAEHFQDETCKGIRWFRNGDSVEIQEWELSY